LPSEPGLTGFHGLSALDQPRCEPPTFPAASAPMRRFVQEDRMPEYRRPGCVTAYALMAFLSGALGIITAFTLPTIFARDPLMLAGTYPEFRAVDPQTWPSLQSFYKYYLTFIFLYSVLLLVIGWGLWTMRNWARVVVLLLQGFSLAAGLFTLFYNIAVSGGSVPVCVCNSALLIVPTWIFLWFFLNRRQFL
jgi:hypothetical protein